MTDERWEPSEQDIADYLEAIYDPDFDVDVFEGLREEKNNEEI